MNFRFEFTDADLVRHSCIETLLGHLIDWHLEKVTTVKERERDVTVVWGAAREGHERIVSRFLATFECLMVGWNPGGEGLLCEHPGFSYHFTSGPEQTQRENEGRRVLL